MSGCVVDVDYMSPALGTPVKKAGGATSRACADSGRWDCSLLNDKRRQPLGLPAFGSFGRCGRTVETILNVVCQLRRRASRRASGTGGGGGARNWPRAVSTPPATAALAPRPACPKTALPCPG